MSQGGRFAKQKGDRRERQVVANLKAHGFEAQRVPLSGAAQGQFGSDVRAQVMGEELALEVKARANGFRMLERWLGEENDAVVVIPDRGRSLVVLDWNRFLKLMREAQGHYERDEYSRAGVQSVAETPRPARAEV